MRDSQLGKESVSALEKRTPEPAENVKRGQRKRGPSVLCPENVSPNIPLPHNTQRGPVTHGLAQHWPAIASISLVRARVNKTYQRARARCKADSFVYLSHASSPQCAESIDFQKLFAPVFLHACTLVRV